MKISHSYVWKGLTVKSCKSAIVDFGVSDVGPGMVPSGSRCGVGRMCVKQRCLDVQRFQETMSRDEHCLRNCNGNGVCNSRGHCHCHKGFSPPDCVRSGAGGSVDSGPESSGEYSCEF